MRMLKTEYRESTRVSQTQLRTLARSPRLFEAMYITGEMVLEASSAMKFGTMVHSAILEPELFRETYVAIPESALASNGHRRGKAWEQFVDDSAAAGKIPISSAESKAIEKISFRVAEMPEVQLLLESSRGCDRVERPIYWDEDRFGVGMKGIPDVVCETKWIVDLKTTSDFEGFFWQFRKQLYGIQAAAYIRGASKNYLGEFSQFAFLVIETVEPFRVRCCYLPESMLYEGHVRLDMLLFDYARRLQTGDWSEDGEFELCPLSDELFRGLKNV